MVISKTVLILSANPIDTNLLRLQQEEREIKHILRRAGCGKFVIHNAPASRIRDIHQAFLDYKPHVVHFSGHGTGETGLVFEDSTGIATLVSSKALADLFRLFACRGVECVVLNACYSAAQANAIGDHIEYVVGMNQLLGDKAAIEFTVGFYTGLVSGESYEFSFELGRNAIQLANIPEYSTPVLLKKKKISNTEIKLQQKELNYQQISTFINEEAIQIIDDCHVDIEKQQEENLHVFAGLQRLNHNFDINHQSTVLPIHEDKLDYTNLIIFLQSAQWQKANEETYKLLLSVTGKQKIDLVKQDEIKNISCDVLHTIDELWVKFSNSHFGFSVQKFIYQSEKRNNIHIRFAERVGWIKDGEWLSYDKFEDSFSNNMLIGYLPICIDLQTCEETKFKLDLQWNRFLNVFFPTFIAKVDFCGL